MDAMSWRSRLAAHVVCAAGLVPLLVVGCAAPPASRTAAPPAPTVGAVASEVTSEPAAGDAEWDALVAAARQEGKVVVYGPPTAEMRTNLPAAFKQRFGIEMEYNGQESGPFSARLASERAAGVYSADAVLAGSDSMFRVIANSGKIENGVMGMLAPLRPALIRPEVLDPAKYRNGKLWFSDPADQYVLRISNQVSGWPTLNTDQVPVSALTAWSDVLKPEYKGKIASYDPTIAGSGLASASFLYATQGEDYVRRFYIGQDVFLSRDHRQLGDLLARGTHPIVFSIQPQEVGRLQKEGYKLADASQLPGGYASAGYGLLGLMGHAPNPNAAKVFVNWMAGPEAMQVFQDAQRQLSTRLDVPVSDFFSPYEVPNNDVQYLDTYDWDYVLEKRAKAQADLREILGRRGG
jgi:iron(III) transport system substrate-binding protein